MTKQIGNCWGCEIEKTLSFFDGEWVCDECIDSAIQMNETEREETIHEDLSMYHPY